VLEDILCYSSKNSLSDLKFCEDNTNVSFIMDVCGNLNICDSVTKQVISLFNKLSHNQNKIKNRLLATYALYHTLRELNISKPAEEIITFAGVSVKKLHKADNYFNTVEHLSDPSKSVDQYCTKLKIPYYASKCIEEFVAKNHDKCAVTINCLIASAIHIYCKKNNISLTLKSICATCWVSTASVHRFTKTDVFKSKEKKVSFSNIVSVSEFIRETPKRSIASYIPIVLCYEG
jgi:transcription initiation factor TFIIIB Brf1 subunit/transcription initiation factor TFIIB